MTESIAFVGPVNLGPYHLARYNALADLGVDLTVICCPIGEYQRPWRFDQGAVNFRILRPFEDTKARGASGLSAGVSEAFSRIEPDVVISIGYASKFAWAFGLACRARGIPNLLLLIGNRNAKQRSALFRAGRFAVCKSLFSGALVPGVRGAEFAYSLGMPWGSVWHVGNCVDNTHFQREQGGVDRKANRHFLYVGRVSPEKNLRCLLNAFRAYRQEGGSWGLQIVGDGPALQELRDSRSSTDVRWRGWVDYETLPKTLSAASALVLPSAYEPWGLVINEALAAGLPVIVSDSCGCAPDLCREGVNGFRFDPASESELSRALKRVADLGEAELARFGEASAQIVRAYGVTDWAQKILGAVRSLLREE